MSLQNVIEQVPEQQDHSKILNNNFFTEGGLQARLGKQFNSNNPSNLPRSVIRLDDYGGMSATHLLSEKSEQHEDRLALTEFDNEIQSLRQPAHAR